ncbi:hypothetical protein Xhom_04931 [Xenorhabdus hominickii]|uniref:Uncharacterized protein n=1 Tax=Xenorhabdus hominickii TaxID=351679 RepID=A0A1V0M4R1_XENHO|nr:hypothetical protein [Xenorhabdus hominickii]PHM51432.1 hypothetical protein Xhom_04931 [Xenorhabdus hominickii]
MNRKLAACILAFVIGTAVTANASASLCSGHICGKIPWDIAYQSYV